MSFLLEHYVYGLDNPNLWICFAIKNDFMLKLLRSGDIEEMFFPKTIIPATIPGGQPIGILLPSTGKRGAGQCLHVNVALGVCVCSQVCLSLSARTRHAKDRRRNNHQRSHPVTPVHG